LTGRRALTVVFLLTLPLVTLKIRGADEIQHFAHLRSIVFDGDLDHGDEYARFYAGDPDGLAGFKETFLERREPDTGRHINFAPVGSAVLWSPFYLLAHGGVLLARALGSDVSADGYSRPYVAAVSYASALWGFVGLLLVHDALRRWAHVEEPATTWTVAALWLGTPVLYYMTLAPAFGHANSLLTVSLLVWLWLRARERPDSGLGSWALIGAAGGVAGMVREQDLLFLAVPGLGLAWDTVQRREWRAGFGRGVALTLGAALAFLPQLLAYRALTGGFSPTRLVRRKLSYTSPHFLEVLFDPGHGLYFWCPLLLLATAGLAWAFWRRRDLTVGLLAASFLLQAWINGSLESWTQAGAFGSRRFVSTTAVFAWGLAAVVAFGLRRFGRAATAAALAVLVWWNVSLIVQFGLKLMDRQRLEWPRVAVNQVTEVPHHLLRAAWLFFTDRERLAREAR
jgi:hypothetical protein